MTQLTYAISEIERQGHPHSIARGMVALPCCQQPESVFRTDAALCAA